MADPTLVIKPTDESRTVLPPFTYVQDDAHLFCPIAPGETVYFLALLRVKGDSPTADLRYTFRVPPGATLAYSPIGGLHAGPADTIIQSNEHGNGTGVGTALKPLPRQHCVMGVVQNGEEAGTVRFQWGQNTEVPTETITVLALSCLMVWHS